MMISTLRDARLLCILAAHPDQPLRVISEHARHMGETLNPGNVGNVLARLCTKGLADWMTVDRPAGEPGRYPTVSLYRITEAGRIALRHWSRQARAVASRDACLRRPDRRS